MCYVSVWETRENEAGRWGGRKSQVNWSIIPPGDQRLGIPRAPENGCDHSKNRFPEPENQRPASKRELAKVENLWISGGGRSEGPALGPKGEGGPWLAGGHM